MSDGNHISRDAVIHPGCRISGSSIGPGCEIGAEAPVTIENCQLGRGVKLKGGFFSGAVFLDGANMGSGAHVREGTILEEEANGAHTVGLKQTVLLPFVTLGSLINFCDILMAGGTSRKNHSEVGSSYIHFNFTPNQDKATASLVGDVPRGVLLNQKPVFLGGQGGLVGPARIAYGCVIAAGGICRKDVLEENQLHVPAVLAEKTVQFEPGIYKNIDRIVRNNLIYIGNVCALKAWYENVRVLFIRDDFDRACHAGAVANLDLILNERIQRLEKLTGKPVCTAVETPISAGLMKEIEKADKVNYVSAVQSLSEKVRAEATTWLQSIVDKSAAL
jgi:UDP-N-acetylglucosamine/UDP-N-acetylgalactosamine diphosphorylase